MQARSTRLPSDNELRVVHADEVFRVVLVNISTTGARFDHLGQLQQGAPVTLRHLEMRVPASVAWSNDKETAVQFTNPLSNEDLAALSQAIGGGGVWASMGHQEPQETK